MPIFTSKKDLRSANSFFVLIGLTSMTTGLLTYSITNYEFFIGFLISQLLVGASLLSIALSVYLFFLKKNVALLIGVIVFKWPILIWLVYEMTTKYKLTPISFVLGFLPLLIGAFVWSFFQKE